MPEKIEVLVDGGAATAGPPLGPALGPLGVNIMQVVNAINTQTKQFSGMKVPVKVIIDRETKKFEISVGTPPASALILKELGKEKGSGKSGTENLGDLTMVQAIKIAKMKGDGILGKNLKKAVKEVIGTCISMGVTVEGKNPRDAQKDIDAGLHNEALDEKAEKP